MVPSLNSATTTIPNLNSTSKMEPYAMQRKHRFSCVSEPLLLLTLNIMARKHEPHSTQQQGKHQDHMAVPSRRSAWNV